MNAQINTVVERRRALGARRRRTAALVAAVVGLALVAGACSDSSDSSSPATTAPPAPVDFSQRGPYPVGRTILALPDRQVYVFYPADPAAVADAAPIDGYSSIIGFPESVRAVIPPEIVQDIPLDSYDQPAPSPEGPFPTIIYSHGAGDYAAFASQHFEHMASWGFVTASPEHIERDLAASTLGQTRQGDDVAVLRATLALLGEQNTSGPLAGAMNLDQLAAEGLSAGGSAVLRFAQDPEVKTVIGRAPGYGVSIDVPEAIRSDAEARRAFVDQAIDAAYAATPPPDKPSMIIAGEVDETIPLANIERTFAWLAPPKRFAVIAGGGHNAFTDLCAPIRAGGGLMQFSGRIPAPDALLARGEDGCTEANIDPQVAYDLIDQLTVAQLRNVFGIDAPQAAASLERAYLDELFPGALSAYEYVP
jgi:dienelactone hydrolase